MQLIHNQLNKLNTKLGGSISRIEGDRLMQCDNNKGVGHVVSVALEAGISYTEYTLNLVDDLKLELDNSNGSVLYFIYCLEGNINYAWADNAEQGQEILELQTVILGSRGSSLHLHIQKEQKTSFALIKVDKAQDDPSFSGEGLELNQKLFDQFLPTEETGNYEYHGTFNLKIKEQLLQIRAIRQTGLVRKLLVKGIINFTLALELMHHKRDTENKKSLSTRLTKKELLRVSEAIETIAHKPEYPYTINYLCRQYCLSATKLQEGFKVLEGSTVANFIKKQRVELAEELIKAGELNISEVVYTIGLTSRSYFSKIFKQRYKCTPKYYQEKCKKLASA